MQTTNDTQEVTMQATLDRYLAMWNEPDAAVRAESVYAVVSDDARLVDPLVDATGPDRIAVAISELRDQMPGHSLTRTTAVDAHHDTARFGWTVNAPDGSVAVAGIDVVTFAADGRIASAVGFFGELSPV
ncbi:MAG: nuclear transport factor 2 family protein [Acidimicrobiia bacterium]